MSSNSFPKAVRTPRPGISWRSLAFARGSANGSRIYILWLDILAPTDCEIVIMSQGERKHTTSMELKKVVCFRSPCDIITRRTKTHDFYGTQKITIFTTYSTPTKKILSSEYYENSSCDEQEGENDLSFIYHDLDQTFSELSVSN